MLKFGSALSRRLCLVLPLSAALAFFPMTSLANPLNIQADTVHFDAKSQRYIATGNVAITRDQRRLYADRIEYDSKQGIIHAFGAVELIDEDGTRITASEMKVDDVLIREKIENFTATIPEGARLVAARIRKVGEKTRHFEYLVYTPCGHCNTDPDKPPIWQMKSRRAEHDLINRDYILHDAVLEIAGWPVFYTPYFRHPDSSVKRRSGFLTPTIGGNNLGQHIVAPYFLDLGLDKNLLVTPIKITNGAAVDLDYIQKLDTGRVQLRASYGALRLLKNHIRQQVGHYEVNLDFKPRPFIAFGGNLRHTSNPGYLAQLPQSSSDFGTLYSSNLYWRRFGEHNPRNLLEASIYRYHDNRTSLKVDTAPQFIPEVAAQFYSEADSYGGRFQYSLMARSIEQKNFAHTQNIGLSGNYAFGEVHPYGILGQYQLDLNLDYFRYNADHPDLTSGSDTLFYPRFHANWRLPFQRSFDDATGVFEPILSLSSTPGSVNSSTIPNQDAGVLANNEALLFSSEKISGRTRRDDSTRASIAAEYDHYWHGGMLASLLIGRNFELRQPSTRTNEPHLTRLEKRDNDYILRVKFERPDGLFLEDRLTIDNDNGNRLNGHEIEASWPNMFAGFSPSVDYAYHRPDPPRKLGGREQFSAGFQQRLGEFWIFEVRTHYDLDHTNDKFRKGLLRLYYEDESLKLSTYFKRDRNASRYIDQQQVWGINVDLKFGG